MFKPLEAITKLLEKRNTAISTAFEFSVGKPTYPDITIAKAVKEGFKINPWVFRAVSLTADSGSVVPWFVVDENGEKVEKHHLNDVLSKPNKQVSRQTIFQLLIQWRQLTGNGYLWKNKVSGKTVELWPVSPDRIAPVAPAQPDEWVKGYKTAGEKGKTYDVDEIIHFLVPDPANPIIGIGALQAAAKTVATVNEQMDWNKAAMENRGVLDGMVTFKDRITDMGLLDTLKEKINESMGGSRNARKIGALGSDASYVKFASTPAELDFMESRKSYIQEILITFGVPPVLVGYSEGSTFNNFQTSQLVFIIQTIIPMLDDFANTMTMSFDDELADGESVGYDVFSLAGIQQAMANMTESAQKLSEMGVPFEQINRVFKFPFTEYAGWDESYRKTAAPTEVRRTESRSKRSMKLTLRPLESRSIDDEFEQRETFAEKQAPKIESGLTEQVTAAADHIEANPASLSNSSALRKTIEGVVADNSEKLSAAVASTYLKQAKSSSADIVIEQRNADVDEQIVALLESEDMILRELSLIDGVTVDKIMDAVSDGLEDGLSMAELREAILAGGIDDPARALVISRTIVGTAGSIGQLAAGIESGATSKTWSTSASDVRSQHTSRNGETVDIDNAFSKQGFTFAPRYPLDQRADAGDRINCRCALTFGID